MDIFCCEDQKIAVKRQLLICIFNILVQQNLLSEEENHRLKLLLSEWRV